jgi:hypothetical protein
MRLFTALFTLYVFLLSVSACADDGCTGEAAHMDLSAVQAMPDHAEHADLCSPFCSCNCCAGLALVKMSFFPSIVRTASVMHADERTVTCAMPRPPVWQPPQA